MSLALYRKYRPGTLAEVIGQDHVVEPLGRALDHDRVHHAYLFSGPRGCGKTSSARILARSLNCEQGPTSTPCGKCNSCIDLAPNGSGSIDVIEMDAATHGLVDDARDLREKAVYAPASSRYKIYIIDEAHQLGPGAANALLKLVEEPPPHLRFVFATTEPDKIIGTIRSRTHHYGFRLVPARTLQTHLASICEQEESIADPGALALISRAAGGSVRDALSIMGQLLAGSGPEGLTYEEAASQLGVTDAALIDELVLAMADYDGATMFRIIDAVVETGHDPRRFVTDLLERLRDLLIVAGVPDAAESGLIDGPIDRLGELREQTTRFGPGELSRHADLVSKGLSELKGATAPRLQLELLAARLVLPAADSGPQSLVARIEHLERAGVGVAVAGVATTSTLQPTSGSAHAAKAQASARVDPQTRSSSLDPDQPDEIQSDTSQSDPDQPDSGAVLRSDSDAPRSGALPPGRLSDVAPATAVDAADSTKKANPAKRRPGSGPPPKPTMSASVKPVPANKAPANEVPANKVPANEVPANEAPANEAPAMPLASTGNTQVSIEQVRALWPTMLEEIRSQSKVVWMMLLPAHPVSLEDGVLVASHKDIGTVKRYQQTNSHDETVAQVTKAVIGIPLRIQLVSGDGASQSAALTSPSGNTGSAKVGAPTGSDAGASAQQSTAASTPDRDDEIADSVDVDEVAGIELLKRELGGVQITEYDGG